MPDAVLYVHGRGGSAGEAEHYRPLFPGCEVLFLDYRGTTDEAVGQEIREALRVLGAAGKAVTLVANSIGEYGVCIDDVGGGRFRYLIAGKYTGGPVPEGMALYEFPRGEWAVFHCVGPNPQTLQRVNTRIFREWLPLNADYELSGNATVEWYDCVNGEKTDPDYHSAIWVPVKRRK